MDEPFFSLNQARTDLGNIGRTKLYELVARGDLELLKLDGKSIIKRALVEADVPAGVKDVIRQEMARYGMIGKKPVTAEDGLTTVTLTDGRKVQFYGAPEPLAASCASTNASAAFVAFSRLLE